jgi:hypothetical protein
MTLGSVEGTVLPTKFSLLIVIAFPRREEGLLTILLVLEIAQTRPLAAWGRAVTHNQAC